MQTICMDGQCFKNYLQMVLNGKKNVCKFDEEFTKNMTKTEMKDIVLQ